MKTKSEIGNRGEQIACRMLKKNKYKIITKNFRCKQGEIDIIAEDKDKVLCFIEVKARSSTSFGLPEEAVTQSKQKKLLNSALVYLEKNKLASRSARFDIVSVNLQNDETRLIHNAFDADI